MNSEVRVRREPVLLPTYEPDLPDKNPMFLEKRVYQGSSGRVYPLPFFNRISEEPRDVEWDAIYLDNGLIEVMLLPQIGGRVHAIRDLTNGYDAIYRQHVIKPALVGLGGPWVSGGIEFNWPQHHRPSTFMPCDVAIQHDEDGSITVWMGEHEPMDRTKGMHGICLYPGRSVVEIKARLYNRTPYTQTFLWWTNIGTHVHEGYKSFFPPDAHLVADHAKRAISTYPLCDGRYYGVDYAARGAHGIPEEERPRHFVPAHCGGSGPEYAPNDLSWFANIPVPTSYMCVGTEEDFVGGYDHFAKAGLLHVADHHIAPGKKQWTWGNQEFGYAWDRNLTEKDGPYIELMAGVYTDNQPDFSYIAPGETRTFSQFLFPYREIGPAWFANVDVAIGPNGVSATRSFAALIEIGFSDGSVDSVEVSLAPSAPYLRDLSGAASVRVSADGQALAIYRVEEAEPKPMVPATEPPLPFEVESSDELFVIGQHLEQYRHATRSSALYWQEALRRDPGDVRCNNALGLWHLKRGEFSVALGYFEKAISRITSRNPNPYDGEPYYNLGLVLRFLGRDKEAADAFAKAAWNAAWQPAAYHALGELACRRQDWTRALDYLDKAVRKDADNLRARNLRAMVLGKLGRPFSVAETLELDPLDHWAAFLSGQVLHVDNQVRLDLAIDLMRAGLADSALELLEGADLTVVDGSAPMVLYYRAFLTGSGELYTAASAACPDYCFPARLEDIAVLSSAPASDAQAALYLGNLMYDQRRYDEAISLWERSSGNPIALRNLGIASFNVRHDANLARSYYDGAIELASDDARLWYERDQLWKRLGLPVSERLEALSLRPDLVAQRDDLTLEYAGLLLAAGRPLEALGLLEGRRFQPWEGGESMVLGLFTRIQLALSQLALASGRAADACAHCEAALEPPLNLGEARHILANASDLWLAYGDALFASGSSDLALKWWTKAAEFQGDFQEMAIQPYSELTYFQAVALRRLGREEEALALVTRLLEFASSLETSQAKIDYFATSLPTMLLFEDDLQARQEGRARFIRGQVAGF